MKTYKVTVIISILCLCLIGCKQSKNGIVNQIEISKTHQKKDTLLNTVKKVDIANITCVNSNKKIDDLNGVYKTKEVISDWVITNILIPYSYDKNKQFDRWSSKDSITKTITSYKYKDSAVFYVHIYKDLKQKKTILDRVIHFEGKLSSRKIIGKAGERTLLYFIEDNEKHDIVLIDIPPNWNHLQLREELLNELYKTFDCTYLLCNRMTPCEYKN